MGRVALALALLLAGCDGVQKTTTADDQNPLTYFRDERTGLCFAMYSYSVLDSGAHLSYMRSVTNVPCTEDVKKAIQ